MFMGYLSGSQMIGVEGHFASLVQSTLSHLQSPPEQMQSQHNYGSSCQNDTFMDDLINNACPKLPQK